MAHFRPNQKTIKVSPYRAGSHDCTPSGKPVGRHSEMYIPTDEENAEFLSYLKKAFIPALIFTTVFIIALFFAF